MELGSVVEWVALFVSLASLVHAWVAKKKSALSQKEAEAAKEVAAKAAQGAEDAVQQLKALNARLDQMNTLIEEQNEATVSATTAHQQIARISADAAAIRVTGVGFYLTPTQNQVPGAVIYLTNVGQRDCTLKHIYVANEDGSRGLMAFGFARVFDGTAQTGHAFFEGKVRIAASEKVQIDVRLGDFTGKFYPQATPLKIVMNTGEVFDMEIPAARVS